MCNFKSGQYTMSDLEAYYHFMANTESNEEFKPHFYENGFDHLYSPIMTAPGIVSMASWGLIPWYTKTLDQALIVRNQALNARSEEMYEKASYKDSLKDNKRCLIPATGFFEWHWNDPKGKEKQPYYIHTKNKLFSFAGVWSTWKDKQNDKIVQTYSIMTCPANPLMERIHNNGMRMPVIIPNQYLNDWLNPNLSKEDILAFCKPYDNSLMDAYPIDKKIGSTKIKSAEKDNASILEMVELIETQPEEKHKAKRIKGDPDQGSLF